jgi:hypothetical protein
LAKILSTRAKAVRTVQGDVAKHWRNAYGHHIPSRSGVEVRKTNMNEKNMKELTTKFPFFSRSSVPGVITTGFGFDCGDGWYKLIYKLCKDIQTILDASPRKIAADFRAVQVKEKFAQLRFYAQGGNEAINKLIVAAESKSSKICERCGKEGKLRDGDWLFTLCDKCHKTRKKTRFE